MSESSFSFEDLQAADHVEISTSETTTASDGIALSYRQYTPATKPRAAVLFYPAELLASNKGLVASYSVNMANALTPSAPQQQFTGLAEPARSASKASSIAHEKHLSVLINAHETVGPWISSLTQGKNA